MEITPKFAKYTNMKGYEKLIGSGRAEFGKKADMPKIDMTKANLDRAEQYVMNDQRDTSETAKAYWSASSLLEEGDQQAARMAFRDAYNRELSDARQSGMPVKWEVTLGHDKQQREAALLMAAERNRIGLEQVKGLLPYLENGEVPKEVLALANKMSAA
jgi:hypothetical protein